MTVPEDLPRRGSTGERFTIACGCVYQYVGVTMGWEVYNLCNDHLLASVRAEDA